MADLPQGYRDVPEEDRKKAQVFVERGRTVAGTGNYEYGIEMFLQGLWLDPDAIAGHQELRDISLRRKASGGKGLGMLEAMKLKRVSKDDKENLRNAEKLLAYDPGNTDHMLSVLLNAHRAGFYDTVLWMGPILLRANADSPRPDITKFLALRDVYKSLQRWKLAADSVHYALRLRPDDMDLQTDVKNFGAMETMQGAGYDKGGSFRDQVRDMKGQLRLLDGDKEVADVDVMTRLIADAQKEMEADPSEPGKAMKLVDLLAKTDNTAQEDRAVGILQKWFDKTKQARFRQRIGQIKMKQLQREDRAKRKAAQDSPENPEVQAEYAEFKKRQIEFELSEYINAAEAYPTDMSIRFEIGKRHYTLRQFDEAISDFQQARSDPKFKVEASVLLARTFLDNGFFDEADDTIATLTRDYPQRDGPKFKEMHYWRGRILEQKGATADAIKEYSQVFQLESGYMDVSARIKRLRTGAPPVNT